MQTPILPVDTTHEVQHQHMGLPVLVVLMLMGCAGLFGWSRWVRPMNLAIGFFVSVTMWSLCYVAMLQPGQWAGELLFAMAAAMVFFGGWLAASRAPREANGISVGLVSATVNLMVLGAFLRDEQGGGWTRPALYVAGLFLGSAVLGMAGDMVGRSRPSGRSLPPASALMPRILVENVLLMVIMGGLVTSFEAGLAVPDWPNSFGHNMLLYPVSEMKGGIFYEHAHRLFGMLVGATTIACAATAWRSGGSRGAKLVASLLVAAVIAQGALGGLRVTGTLTSSTEAKDLAPSTALAIVHGMLGQGVLALAMVLAFLSSPGAQRPPVVLPAVRSVRVLPPIALVALVLQLFLGASMRHLQVPPTADAGAKIPQWALHGHVTMAIIAFILVLLAGIRCGRITEVPTVRILGKAVTHTVGLQFLLGIGALVAVLLRRGDLVPWWEAVATTAHQTIGALLLALTAALTVAARSSVLPAVRA